MRERLVPHHNVGHVGRITPARAGKTHHYLLGQGIVRDHPRSCGKDLMHSFFPSSSVGSPPLVRERLNHGNAPFRKQRITPARAGKTPELFRLAMDIRDHPRSCGKDCSWGNGHEDSQGSPPLVRERQTAARLRTSPARITPARAGKTTCRSRANPCRRDHPRSCGKDCLSQATR